MSSCEVDGEIRVVEIQALIRKGLFRFDIIGLPKNMIKEGRDRILSVLYQLGLSLPNQRILISLNPSDLPKEGSHFDLPILIALLEAMGQVQLPQRKFAWGELQLDGKVRSFDQVLSHQLLAESYEADRVIRSREPVIPDRLSNLFCVGQNLISECKEIWDLPTPKAKNSDDNENLRPEIQTDPTILVESQWNSLRGSPEQFLLFCIAAHSRQHLLLEGPPGVGKTYWATSLQELQPPLQKEQLLERLHWRLSKLEEIQGLRPPFEQAHHSSSMAALVGGGSGRLQLGAITRAHFGILFLDEFGEFNRQAIEALREPLEAKSIRIARSRDVRRFPADIQLVATMNPCRCGNFESQKLCLCSTSQLQNYRSRVSQAIRDRFHWPVKWTFHNQAIKRDYRRNEVLARLLSARKHPSRWKAEAKFSTQASARQQKLRLERIQAWAQWLHLTEITTQSLYEFNEFEKFWSLNEDQRNSLG